METNTDNDNSVSPLAEVTPDAIDHWLNAANEDLIAGMPERLTPERLAKLVDLYRAQALRWEQEEQIRAQRPSRRTTHREAIDL